MKERFAIFFENSHSGCPDSDAIKVGGTMNDALSTSLRQLRLSGMAKTLDVRLQEAAGNRLNHQEFLELILKDELTVRNSRQIERRVKVAGFRDKKTLEDFDWHFNTSVKRQQIYELATGAFVRESRDCLMVGPPGIGKSHLVQALGYQLIKLGFIVLYRSIFDVVRDFLEDEALVQTDRTLNKYLKPDLLIFDVVRDFLEDEALVQTDRTLNKYLKPDLLIVDDMGMKQLPKRSGEYLFEIIMRRYEVRSTIMTSNRPIEEWGKLLCDVPAATAILDRFLHRAEIIAVNGRSYRLKDKAAKPSKPLKPDGNAQLKGYRGTRPNGDRLGPKEWRLPLTPTSTNPPAVA